MSLRNRASERFRQYGAALFSISLRLRQAGQQVISSRKAGVAIVGSTFLFLTPLLWAQATESTSPQTSLHNKSSSENLDVTPGSSSTEVAVDATLSTPDVSTSELNQTSGSSSQRVSVTTQSSSSSGAQQEVKQETFSSTNSSGSSTSSVNVQVSGTGNTEVKFKEKSKTTVEFDYEDSSEYSFEN